jgi:hypothetical protein
VSRIGHQQPRPGQAHDLARLLGSEPGVEGREDRAQLRQRDEERQDIEPRLRPGDDAIAVPDAQLCERGSEAVARLVELAVAQAGGAQGSGHPIGNDLRVAPEDLADQHGHVKSMAERGPCLKQGPKASDVG